MKRHEIFIFFLCSTALIPISEKKFLPYIFAFSLFTAVYYLLKFRSFKELILGLFAGLLIGKASLLFQDNREKIVWTKKYGENYKVAVTSKFRYIPLKGEGEVGDLIVKNKIVHSNSLDSKVLKLRKKLYERIEKEVNYPVSALSGAITLGIRQEIPPSIKSYFVLSGVYHLLAISGLHVGIILSAIGLMFRFFKVRKPWSKAAITILPLLPLTGFAPSVIRAYIFLSLLSIGMENFRKTSPLYLLGITMLITIILHKFNLSAVLSFLAVLGIIVAASSNTHKTVKTFLVPLAPMLFTLPVILYQFGTVNLLSSLNSVVAELLFTPYLVLTFLSEVTNWEISPLTKLTEFTGVLFIKITKWLFLLTKEFVVYSKVSLTVSATALLIVLIFTVTNKLKSQLAVLGAVLIFALLTQKTIENKTLKIKGWKVNSFYFLSTEGQRYKNCTLIADYVFPYARKILYRNKLIDKRAAKSRFLF